MSLLESRLKTGLSAAIKTKMEAAFGLVSIPGYSPTEFQKFCDAMGDAISQEVIKEFKDNAELDAASLDDQTVSGTTDTTTSNATQALDNGQVDDATVSGGIK